MNAQDATKAVVEMFGAVGMKPADSVITELAKEVRVAECASCATEILDGWKDGGVQVRFQPVPTFRRAYGDRLRSADHFPHVGQDQRVVSVGKIEAHFRSKVAEAIRSYIGCSREESLFLAGTHWQQTSGEINVEQLREHVCSWVNEQYVMAEWVVASLKYLEGRDIGPMAEHAFDVARAIATAGGAEKIPQDAWLELMAREPRPQREPA